MVGLKDCWSFHGSNAKTGHSSISIVIEAVSRVEEYIVIRKVLSDKRLWFR